MVWYIHTIIVLTIHHGNESHFLLLTQTIGTVTHNGHIHVYLPQVGEVLVAYCQCPCMFEAEGLHAGVSVGILGRES